MQNNPSAYVIVAVGLFSMAGAYFDWDWYVNGRRARLFANCHGHRGARTSYGFLGAALVVFGLMMVGGR